MLKPPMLNKLPSVLITSAILKVTEIMSGLWYMKSRIILKVGKYPASWGFLMHFCMYKLRELWNRDRGLIYQSNPFSQQIKNLPAMQEMAGDMGSIPRWGRSPGEGNGNPLQYSFLENPIDTGAW